MIKKTIFIPHPENHVCKGLRMNGFRAGFRLKEIQKCADLITEAYHQKGYITSRAYIPLQQFAQGILEIRAIEGIA